MATALSVVNRSIKVVKPPTDMLLSDWAEDRRYISPAVSAYPGRWQIERVPYMKEIMDCCNDPMVNIITIMKASRMAVTEGLINNRIGYNVDVAPRPMLYVQQNLKEAAKYSDLMLKYLIEDTPVVAKKAFSGQKETNTKTIKTFRGCSLILAGANVSSGFRMVEVHDVYCDDVDAKDWKAGEEGSKIDLALGRLDNAPDGYSLGIIASSPGLKPSRIERRINLSDKRYYNVPCPFCDHGQVLKLGGRDKDYGLKWENRDPDTVYYLCEQCRQKIQEWHKPDMMNQGVWKPTAEFTGNAGFHISRYYSLFIPWKKSVKKFLDAGKSPAKLQVFFNTVDGTSFEHKSRALKSDTLYGRREMYGPEVPNEAPILTVGVDVQENRLELEIIAWGTEEESWNMYYHVLWGDTILKDVWDQLDKILLTPLHNLNGNKFYVMGVAIDRGYRPKQVEAFVKPRQKRMVSATFEQHIIAIRGANEPGKPIIADKPFKAQSEDRMQYYWVGTDTAKDTLFSYMGLLYDEDKKRFGPGYMHFPVGDDNRGYPGREESYFMQLTSEKVSEVQDKHGNTIRVWELIEGRRNEALDCRVYAYAALMHLVNNCKLDLNKYVIDMKLIIEKGKPKYVADLKKKKTGQRVINPGIDKGKYGG